jgi:NAD(P)-dependent dehydrogenase (short-subunit alcohol dehydrogenase family)
VSVVIVTGAGSGIGRASALKLAAKGSAVAAWDSNEEHLSRAVEEIIANGGRAVGRTVDVRDDAAVAEGVDHCVATLGALTGAFNCAGIGLPVAPLAETKLEDFDAAMATNVRGIFSCMRHQIPRMIAGGGGAIVNMSSVAGVVALAGESAYTASKHAVIGLSKAAAVEYGPAGIRVNSVCPGAIKTPMLDFLAQGGVSEADLVALQPIGRIGETADVADTVAWLLLDAPTMITGSAINIDGGWSAQ